MEPGYKITLIFLPDRFANKKSVSGIEIEFKGQASVKIPGGRRVKKCGGAACIRVDADQGRIAGIQEILPPGKSV